MSACHAFSNSSDEFDVTLYDSNALSAARATSYQLPRSSQVQVAVHQRWCQGASPVFYNTFKVFEHVLGFKAQEVGMQISFGKGKESFWSNVFPSELVEKYSKTSRNSAPHSSHQALRGTLCRHPVHRMLKMFGFSDEFGERMVYRSSPLLRYRQRYQAHLIRHSGGVFLDPSMRLFEFSEDSLLASVPTMMAFRSLHVSTQPGRTR